MATVTLLHTAADAALAARIRSDMTAAGVTIVDTVQPGRSPLTVVVYSAHTAVDSALQNAVIQALDNAQHVIPVLTAPLDLPRLINHLQPVDFSRGYDAAALKARIDDLSRPDAPAPVTVLTPTKRAANQRAGIVAIVLVIAIFVIGAIFIANGTVRAPENEFASVETQIILTRNYFIDESLPRSTEQAANFPATVEHIPTRARAQAIATATGIAGGVEGTFVPRSTQEATNFPATLESVSTIVQERLAATVTAAAGGE